MNLVKFTNIINSWRANNGSSMQSFVHLNDSTVHSLLNFINFSLKTGRIN